MEKAMLNNMIQKTSKPIEEWISKVSKQNFIKNKDIVKFLKEECSVGHFLCSFNCPKNQNNN